MSETAFGGTSLCKQHHIVACVYPYCEIDRLKKKIEELEKEVSSLREDLVTHQMMGDRMLEEIEELTELISKQAKGVRDEKN